MKKLIVILALMLAPTAYANDVWSEIWTMNLRQVLETYLTVEDKAQADIVFDDYLDGFANGVAASYNYGAGNGNELRACYVVSGITPSSLRAELLQNAMDPNLAHISVATYMYARLHITCDVVLGDYMAKPDKPEAKGESS